MQAAPATPDELADHVHELLLGLDPARFGTDAVERCRQLLALAHAGGSAMLAMWSAQPEAAPRDPKLVDAVDGLVRAIPAPESIGTERSEWKSVHDALWPPYEVLARALRAEGASVARIRPTNWLRSAVHLGIGAALVLAFEFVFTPQTAFWAALAWCTWAWSLEAARRVFPRVNDLCMVVFGPIAREHERTRVNSATWLGTGILLLTLTVPDHRGALGLVAIAVGDPVAGAIGRRYGKTKGLHGRSIEGSVAFAIATLVAALAYLAGFHPEVGLQAGLLLAVTAAIVGSVVEHVTVGIDDNLAVPVATGLAVAAVAAVV